MFRKTARDKESDLALTAGWTVGRPRLSRRHCGGGHDRNLIRVRPHRTDVRS